MEKIGYFPDKLRGQTAWKKGDLSPIPYLVDCRSIHTATMLLGCRLQNLPGTTFMAPCSCSMFQEFN
jgi:hypothetical protein